MVKRISAVAQKAQGQTLKAFANSSPGLRLGNPGIKGVLIIEDATL